MKNLWILLTIVSVLFLLSTANACSISIDDFAVDLRSTGDYGNSISAEDNDDIDIRINFTIDDISGTDCASNISSRARVYRWDEDDDEWDLFRTTTTKSQTLEEDTFSFIWSNDFSVDDQYERYKIEGEVLEGTNQLEIDDAYIDIENNSCSGINLVTTNFVIDEGRTVTKTFYIENNTNTDFEVQNADVTFSTNIVTNGSVDYDDTVRDGTTENVSVELEGVYTSYDRTATGTFKVSGYLGSQFCSDTAIGRKTFTVTVEDTGSSGSSSTSTSSDCDDLEIKVRDITVRENESTQEVFYLENNNTKRFEITDVEVIDSGVEVTDYYFEKYAFPNGIADIVVQVNAGNVTENKSYENTLKVKGEFSDGKTCSFDKIDSKKFIVIVENTSGSFYKNCEGFNIDIASTVAIENFGEINFTITNNTNETATINVESDLQVSPSQIVLPANSVLSRTLSVSASKKEGNIYLRTNISGCNTETKTIKVYNNAEGTLSGIEINTRIERDANKASLIVEFNNSTNKTFVGILRINVEGQVINDRTISIPAGQSFTEIDLNPNNLVIGKISFVSEGEVIEKEFDERTNSLTGLFMLGGIETAFGIILLAIVIAIVIIIVLTEPQRRIRERWEVRED